MSKRKNEEQELRSTALQTARSVLHARQRAEDELLHAKEALETRSNELAHSLALMRATFDSTNDGILVVNRDGNVTHFNEQFIEMWHMPRETIATMTHQEVLDLATPQLKEPEKFMTRTKEIYATCPAETIETLEFLDGRMI